MRSYQINRVAKNQTIDFAEEEARKAGKRSRVAPLTQLPEKFIGHTGY
jgi:hypothetical protein